MILLPELEMATLNQVAEFYGVNNKTLTNLIVDHRGELESDGYTVVSGKDLVSALKAPAKTQNMRGYFLLDGNKIGYKANALFPKRAILRVGMLLRDSEVAKEVRTQLLNIEEHTAAEVKTYEIDYEQQLHLKLGQAVAVSSVHDDRVIGL
ncbi:hypothetical protein [Bacillus toyonensis]|uniref:hypothetical protein n=1 Tax=Bacillus toyonensis TaxID=155322 RepID=UPI000BF1E58A|nr:hypothetical protein [Bacillus toyonensis]PEO31452.1 hypothetical protein CN569_17870 [Bacillus toyonensis]